MSAPAGHAVTTRHLNIRNVHASTASTGGTIMAEVLDGLDWQGKVFSNG
jgi:hypothetical protein